MSKTQSLLNGSSVDVIAVTAYTLEIYRQDFESYNNYYSEKFSSSCLYCCFILGIPSTPELFA